MRQAVLRVEPRIETKRLVLRPPEEADLDTIVAEINDFAVVRMLARVPFPYGRTDAEDFLAWSRGSREDVNLVIAEAGRVIGCMALCAIDSIGEFGYWLGRAHWRQGFASEASRAFLAYCFDEFAIDEIRAGAFHDNPASLHVQEKLGFERTGTSLRQSFARRESVEQIDTILTRARFLEATQ